ncbi:MAG: CoA ester lyase [Acuticoccus sp.]
MRSWLFVPADSERKLARAFDTGADVIILDLEDSVAEARKPVARALAREAAADAPGTVAVRINPLPGPHAAADIAAIVPAAPAFIVLPKSEAGRDVTELSARLCVAEAEAGRAEGATAIMAIATETAASLFGLGTYRGASARLKAMAWGAEDLSTALDARRTRLPGGALTDAFALARTLCLAGAHAAGVAPIDTVFTAYKDEKGLMAECAAAAADGFYGKMAIHPAQVPLINAAFTPSAAEIAEAKRVVDAFATAPGAGVLTLDGKMVDRPHLANAERLLARAAAIS